MKLTREDCQNCPCIGPTAKYSNWDYCTNPDNGYDFIIVRWRSDHFPGKDYKIKPSPWCVKLKSLKCKNK